MSCTQQAALNMLNVLLKSTKIKNSALKISSIFYQSSLVRTYDTNASGKFKVTVGDVLNDWNKKFVINNVPEPTESIENILMYILKTRKYADVYRYKHKTLSLRELKEIERLANLRLKRMPVQYIIGEWDFRNLTLKMRPPVFIPRPETEELVDKVLCEMKERKVEKIVEFCCGCGAISLALLKAHENLQVTAVDKSTEACQLTKENAELNNLTGRIHVIQADLVDEKLLEYFKGEKFDLVVSNPPYIPSKDLLNLPKEIAEYEDKDALDGGVDGLKLIKKVLRVSSKLLVKDGKLFLEIDPSHPEMLRNWLKVNEELELQIGRTFRDIFENERFIEIIKF